MVSTAAVTERTHERAHPANARHTHMMADCPAYDHLEPFADTFMSLEDAHPYVRFAKAHAATWAASPTPIGATERIVGVRRPGRIVDTQFALGIVCRMQMAENEIAEHPERRNEIQTIVDYFHGHHDTHAVAREECRRRDLPTGNSVGFGGSYQGHMVVDYAKMLRLGVQGVRAEVADRLARAPAERRPFYESLLIVNDIFVTALSAYAAQAKREAAAAATAQRQAALHEIARICRALCERPPETFHEALQLYWTTMLLDGVDDAGRADQYLIDYYHADRDAGQLTRAQAASLLEELWLKLHQHGAWGLVLGGQLADGSDATNALSYLGLEVTERLRLLTNPAVPVRLHANSPRKLWRKAMEVVANGGGQPALANDDAIVPALMGAGVTLEDARDYGMGGCIEYQVCGKSNNGGEDGDLNLAKCLELALNDGRCRQTGEQLGPRTGAPETFTDFDDLVRAYHAQVEYALDWIMETCRVGHEIKARQGTKIYRSLLIDDCLERGLDCSDGGARYNDGQILTMGTIVVADSLAAVKTLVFEQQLFTMNELVAALQSNWQGYEQLRALIRSRAPRFGNGDPRVDSIAHDVSTHAWSYMRAHPTGRGGHFVGLLVYFNRQLGFGRSTGATPDGRCDGDVLEDSTGPWPGRDTNGPSAMMQSAVAVNQSLASGGAVLNLKLTPASLSTARLREKMIDLVQTYFAMGGQYVQVTVAGPEEMRAAIREPEKWGHLFVRVGGYCARFTDLDPALQESIAQRTAYRG